jgi:hypothetical protein
MQHAAYSAKRHQHTVASSSVPHRKETEYYQPFVKLGDFIFPFRNRPCLYPFIFASDVHRDAEPGRRLRIF